MTAAFGRLNRQEITLREGLNILEAPNETGKSTWCAFLTAMLYGINSRERDRAGHLAEKNRYAPWNGNPMEGKMDFRDDGGRELTLIRRTRLVSSPMGDFRAVYAGTGDDAAGLSGQHCGETLLGVPREVFERSAFIRQAGLGITQDAELERRIVSLVTTGDESTSYTEAAGTLKHQLNRRRHNKTGDLPVLEAERAEILQCLEEMQIKQSSLTQATAQVSVLRAQEQDLMRRLENARRRQAAQKQDTLHAADTAARQTEESARQLRERAETERIPENETIGRLRGAIVNLETVRKALVKAREQRDTAQKEFLLAEAAVQESPFVGKTAEDAHREAQTPPEIHIPAWPYLLPIVLGVPAALLLVRPWSLPDSRKGLFIVLFFAVLAAAVFCCRSWKRAAIRRAQSAALVKRFGTADPTQISTLADTYLMLSNSFEQKRAFYESAKASADGLYASLSSNEQAILLEVRRFAPSAFDISTADRLLRECAVRRKELANAETAAREARIRYETLSQQIPAEDVLSDEDSDLQEQENADPQQLSEALQSLRAELAQAASRADRLSGSIAAVGDSAVLTAQADEVGEKIAVLEQEYASIAVAMEALETANTALQNRFSPALGRRAAEFFSQLTENRWSGVILDRALNLAAEPQDDPIYRDSQYLSVGTLDQLYLAVRLAICELVLPEDRGVPIILDDALANFDDARCAAALKILRREAEKRQILLFTCHSREGAFFRGDPSVSVQRLTSFPSAV